MNRKKNRIISDDGVVLTLQDDQRKTFKICKFDEWILKWYWSVNTQGYVHRGTFINKKYKHILLSRFLLNCSGDFIVEYVNKDTTDLTRNNIRITDHSNIIRRLKKNKISKYRGVCYDKRTKMWTSQISINKRNVYIGTYKTEEEAMIKYNEYILNLKGPEHLAAAMKLDGNSASDMSKK